MKLKKCLWCFKEKPLDAFYRLARALDGHLSKCMECARAASREHRLNNISAYKKRERIAYRKQRAKKTIQGLARTALSQAVIGGRIKRPKRCSSCKSEGTIQGHHEDYTKPLDVVWLCRLCHAARHREMRWAASLVLQL